MATTNFGGFGHSEAVAVTGAKTLALADVGYIQNATATATITLAATQVKLHHLIRIGANGITLTISPNASDKIAGFTATNSGAGTDDKDLIFTSQPVGSFVELEADGTDGYQIVRLLGAPTFQA